MSKPKTCRFIKEDRTKCKGVILLQDGLCMVHSPLAEKAKSTARKEKAKIARKFSLPNQTPMKQARKFCVACAETWRDIQFCASVDCSLWFLRFGKTPKAYIRDKGTAYAGLFNKKNFEEGKKYDPDIEIEAMKL